MNKRTKKTLSVDAVLLRMQNYCAFSERSTEEVRKMMKDFDLNPADAWTVLERLTKAGFINEARFAKSFAGGKFRIKKWGKRKIEVEMKKKGLSEELIEKGLNELPEKDYTDTLDELLKKKWAQISRKEVEKDDYEAKQKNRQKLIRYALQKGYEMDLVMERVKKMGV